jgi:hypothetical protein
MAQKLITFEDDIKKRAFLPFLNNHAIWGPNQVFQRNLKTNDPESDIQCNLFARPFPFPSSLTLNLQVRAFL